MTTSNYSTRSNTSDYSTRSNTLDSTLPDSITSTITLNNYDDRNVSVSCTDKSYRITLYRTANYMDSDNNNCSNDKTVIVRRFPFNITDVTSTINDGILSVNFNRSDSTSSTSNSTSSDRETSIKVIDTSSNSSDNATTLSNRIRNEMDCSRSDYNKCNNGYYTTNLNTSDNNTASLSFACTSDNDIVRGNVNFNKNPNNLSRTSSSDSSDSTVTTYSSPGCDAESFIASKPTSDCSSRNSLKSTSTNDSNDDLCFVTNSRTCSTNTTYDINSRTPSSSYRTTGDTRTSNRSTTSDSNRSTTSSNSNRSNRSRS